MPPIPVHIDEPITPIKAKGVTPQTAHTNEPTKTTDVNPGTTTAVGGPPPAYPAAQPAALPVPGATPFAQPTPTRTAQGSQDAVPPPPQPGAVPAPPTQTSSSLPPPPRTGQGSAFTSVLNSMHTPPPQINYAPTKSTDTTAPTSVQPPQAVRTINLGPVHPQPSPSANHPTGYQQNLFAQEMTPAQRASLDQQEEADRRGSMFAGLPGGASGGASGRGGGGGVIGDDASQTAGNVWSAVKGWASAAGEKVAEAEAAAWKKLDGKK
jgi:hypothetical protein